MSDTDKDFQGVCGHEVYINAKDDGRVAITLNVKESMVGEVTRDEFAFVVAGTLFRHIFKHHLSPHDIDLEQMHLIFEIPETYLQPEWVEALTNSNRSGFEFVLKSDPVTDEVTKFVPKVVINEADNEQQE